MQINIPSIEITEFLKESEVLPIIDVRSPAEFEHGHIPNAINLPLFNNEERAIIGTIYKKQGQEKAILMGLEIVGPKMKDFVIKAKKIAKNNQILIHCWRGGMRSGSMAWLFYTSGIKPQILTGGYKAYRKYIKTEFSKPANILILSGSTGSGKTDILKEIQNKGEQIIDLEGIAHHKGSAFGSIGEKKQNSTEQFENNLFAIWNSLNLEKTIWIEDESKAIGHNFIPTEIFEQMRLAPVIKINISKELRIKRLVNEYTFADKDLLIFYLNKIQKRLGPNETKLAIEAVQKNNMEAAVNLSLNFYDKAYNYGLQKRTITSITEIELLEDEPKKNAKILINFTKH